MITDSSIAILPTIALDAEDDESCIYDGFYANQDPLKVASYDASNRMDENMQRLLESIGELTRAMKSTNAEQMDKILHAAEEEEYKKKNEAIKKQVAESEKLWAGKCRRVEVAFQFFNVSEVDVTNETFAAEVLIISRWREPALDIYTDAELKSIDFDNYFNPNLIVENLMVERRATITNNVYRNDHQESFMIEKTLLRGTFTFHGTLKTFPFDVQDLHVAITTDFDVSQVELVPSDEEMSFFTRRLRVDQLSQTWKFFKHVELRMRTHKADITGSAVDRPGLDVLIRVARIPNYYWYNMYAIVFFVTLLTVFTFVIDPTGGSANAARLQLCSMVFLTCTNFKISVSLQMPKLAYLSCVDKYVLFNILSLSGVTIYNSFMAAEVVTSSSLTETRQFDRFAMISIFCAYIGWNLLYFIWLYFSICKKRAKAARQDSEWKDWSGRKFAWFTYKKQRVQ